MSVQTTYLYDDLASDVYDNTKIEIADGVLKLLRQSYDHDFEQAFASDTDFIYDNTKAEFVAGKLQQKDQSPLNSTCGANYNSDIDLNWGDGVLTGTPIGGADIIGGKLDCTGGASKYVSYDADLNADSQQTGCIRFKLTPNYTGSPPAIRGIFAISEGHNLTDNSIGVYHIGTTLHLFITDSTGGTVFDLTGTWSPMSGVEYEFEINYDLTAGETRFFIDGNLLTSDLVTTGIRDSNIGLLRVGSNAGGTWNPDFYFEDFLIFNTVQHTANYTPGYSSPNFKYVESIVELPVFDYTDVGFLDSLNLFTMIGSGSFLFNIKVGSGDYKYWDGAAWSTANGMNTQANTIAEINTNIASLTEINGGTDIYIKLFFTNNSSTLNDIDNLLIDYTSLEEYATDNPKSVPIAVVLADSITSLSETVNKSGDDDIKYTISVSGIEKYWSGGAWINSDETYAQANTIAEINLSISSLNIVFGELIKIVSYLHSDDGLTTPELDELSFIYDQHGALPGAVNKCKVFGYIVDNQEVPVSDVNISISLITLGEYNDEIIVAQNVKVVTTDAEGYWEVDLIENETMQASNGYKFIFLGDSVNLTQNKIIPNTVIQNFLTLVDL